MEHRTDNPAGEALAQALGRQQTVVRHWRALPHGEVARAIDTIRASDAWAATKLGFEFLVLTATRSAEVRLATWSEIDREVAVWNDPGHAHEGPPRAPRAARPARPRDRRPRRRAARGLGRHRSAGPRLSEPTAQAAHRRDVLQARPGAEDRRRAARLPLLFGDGNRCPERLPCCALEASSSQGASCPRILFGLPPRWRQRHRENRPPGRHLCGRKTQPGPEPAGPQIPDGQPSTVSTRPQQNDRPAPKTGAAPDTGRGDRRRRIDGLRRRGRDGSKQVAW